MHESFVPIQGFEEYLIGTQGTVIGKRLNRPLTWSYARNKIPTVTMTMDGRLYRRSVPLLVAKAWLPLPQRYDFDTPIHLDSDRCNCFYENLTWRPRWFAIEYNRERKENPFPRWRKPILVVETEEVFKTPLHCSYKYGVLERDIYQSIHHQRPVFPHWFNIKVIL